MIKSNELLNNISKAIKTEEKQTRMATVTSIQDGKVYLTFYGEDGESNKPYKRIGSYNPALGDTVVLNRVGSSYVITGKVV